VSAAAERRRAMLASADEDVVAIRREAEARRAQLQEDAQAVREAAVEAAVTLVLPAVEESED
jgi:hypothetical protein